MEHGKNASLALHWCEQMKDVKNSYPHLALGTDLFNREQAREYLGRALVLPYFKTI